MGRFSPRPEIIVLLALLSTCTGCGDQVEVPRLEEKVRDLEDELEAEKARSEAERMRAAQAETRSRVAEERAMAAEAVLEKGRKVSAVLLAAQVELSAVWKALKRSHYSNLSTEAKRTTGEKLRPRFDAFADSAPGDGASQAVVLALEGYFSRLSGRPGLSEQSFASAVKADPDVVYSHLIQAVFDLVEILAGAPIPALDPGPEGFVFTWILHHTKETKARAERVRTRLQRARKGTVWGEASAHEFQSALHGLEAALTGDTHEIESAISRGLSLPELAVVREELLLVRAQSRLYGGNLPGALSDVEQVLRVLPEWPLARFLLGTFRFYQGVNDLESGAGGASLLDGAKDAFAELKAENPADWRALSALAMVRDITGERELAAANLESAIPHAGSYGKKLEKYLEQVKRR